MTIAIIGVIVMVLSIWGMIAYWWSFLEILRGLLPFIGMLLGIIFVGAGIRSSIKKNGES